MGSVSFIVGLVVFLAALFPNLGYFILIPAAFGLILGVVKLGRDGFCGYAASGIVLNGLAVLLAIVWTVIISFATVDVLDNILAPSPQSQPENVVVYPLEPVASPAAPVAPASTAIPKAEVKK